MVMALPFADLLEWIGVGFGLIGQYLIAERRRSAFVIWAISNIALIGLAWHVGQVKLMALYCVYLYFCFYSYREWAPAKSDSFMSGQQKC
jgi:nicotinamide riboside transporter PnuC